MGQEDLLARNNLPDWHVNASEVQQWRRTFAVNQFTHRMHIIVLTHKRWLPAVLAEAGFFKSNGEVKKNRKDLWRELPEGFHLERVKFKWCELDVVVCP
jgi:hypothetical protein